MTDAAETKTEAPKDRMARVRAFRGKNRTRATSPEREPVRTPLKMKAQPNWENMSDAEEGADRMHIPRHLIPEGMDLQWVTSTIHGKPEPQHRASFEKKGWTPVHQSDFDGQFDGMFMPKGADGEITNGAAVLMARPIELTLKARAKQKRDAALPLQLKREALMGGDLPGVSGANHPSALRQNRINVTRERLEIPDE